MEKHIYKLTEKFLEIDNELSQKYYSFLKSLLISSTGFITAIIVFTSVNTDNIYNVIFRSITISSIGLGILFCSILLYGEIVVLKDLQSSLNKHINKLRDGKTSVLDTLHVARKPIYKWIEKICFSFYIIFVVSLILFGLTL